jgi:hypothetical protein
MLLLENLGDAHRVPLTVTGERRHQGPDRLHARILARRLCPLALTRTQHPPHGQIS